MTKTHETTQPSPKSSLAWIAAAILAAIVPYLPSMRGKFVLDDWPLIVNDPLVHSLSNIPRVFLTDFLGHISHHEVPYYRPLVTLSFQINWWMFGAHPLGYKVTNLLLHIAATVLVVLLTLRLTRTIFTAGVAGVAFAVLPAHAESVGWISGRTDVLSCVFVLSALLVMLPPGDGRLPWPRATLGSLLFLCGLLSKESAFVLPALILVYCFAFDRQRIRRDGLVWAAALLIPIVIQTLLHRQATDVPMVAHLGLKLNERLAGVGIAYASYLRMLFIPRAAQVMYDVFPLGIRCPWIAAAAWLLPVGLVALGLGAIRRAPVLAFGALWILLSLLPVTNIIPTYGPLPTERFSYLASVGSAIVLGWIALMLWRLNPCGFQTWRVLVAAMIGWYALYCAALTIEGTHSYLSNITWARALSAGNGRFLRGTSGAYFLEAGRLEDARREYEAAIRYDPDKRSYYEILEPIYLALGRRQEAADIRRVISARFGKVPPDCSPFEER
jgi:hypothetical protein